MRLFWANNTKVTLLGNFVWEKVCNFWAKVMVISPKIVFQKSKIWCFFKAKTIVFVQILIKLQVQPKLPVTFTNQQPNMKKMPRRWTARRFMRQSHQQLGGAATNFRARRKLLISVRAARKWVQHVKGVITMLSLTGGDYSAGVAGDYSWQAKPESWLQRLWQPAAKQPCSTYSSKLLVSEL